MEGAWGGVHRGVIRFAKLDLVLDLRGGISREFQ